MSGCGAKGSVGKRDGAAEEEFEEGEAGRQRWKGAVVSGE